MSSQNLVGVSDVNNNRTKGKSRSNCKGSSKKTLQVIPKHPVSVLNELCQKLSAAIRKNKGKLLSVVPKYSNSSTPKNAGIHKCHVNVDELSALGIGATYKEAKYGAARAILSKISMIKSQSPRKLGNEFKIGVALSRFMSQEEAETFSSFSSLEIAQNHSKLPCKNLNFTSPEALVDNARTVACKPAGNKDFIRLKKNSSKKVPSHPKTSEHSEVVSNSIPVSDSCTMSKLNKDIASNTEIIDLCSPVRTSRLESPPHLAVKRGRNTDDEDENDCQPVLQAHRISSRDWDLKCEDNSPCSSITSPPDIFGTVKESVKTDGHPPVVKIDQDVFNTQRESQLFMAANLHICPMKDPTSTSSSCIGEDLNGNVEALPVSASTIQPNVNDISDVYERVEAEMAVIFGEEISQPEDKSHDTLAISLVKKESTKNQSVQLFTVHQAVNNCPQCSHFLTVLNLSVNCRSGDVTAICNQCRSCTVMKKAFIRF